MNPILNPIFTVLISKLLEVLAALAVAGIGIAGTWLLGKLAQKQKFQNVANAVALLTEAAQQTVQELQQTIVDDLKAKGKLGPDVVEDLKTKLITLAEAKVSPAVIALIESAGIDVTAVIQGAGESMIWQMKAAQPIALLPAEENEPVGEPLG